MGIFFVYILKSSVCLALFYLFYRLLLSKETFHRFNRLALLGLLMVSSLVPLLKITMAGMAEVSQPLWSLEEMMLMAEAEPAEVLVETPSRFPWIALMFLVYLSGILFFVGRHVWSLGRMVSLLRTSEKERLEGGITLFVHDNKEVAPFSWMKYIVVSRQDLEENRRAVLAHERAHIRNLHSWDLLLAEVCIFLQWFNPAAWLLKQELQTIHEYEADEWVINNGIDAKTYQLLLIKKAVGARLYSIANSFNHSSLKKRITMMIKKKSNPWARLKYLYVLPLAAVAVAAFARPEVSNELNEISSVKVNDLTSIVKTEEVKSVENFSDEKFVLNGQVMEHSSKNPVPGASIIIRGTTVGTLSDEDGKFSLDVKKGDVIVVSYIGLQTQQLPIEGAGNLVVWMKDDVQSMEEMTVLGDGSNRVGILNGEPGKKVVSVEEIPEVKIKEVKVDETEQSPSDATFQVVEEMPEFPGGMQACMVFLAKNIKYPVSAQEAKIEGRVIVQFIVKKDGSIADPIVMRGVSPELDAEALRVVSLMPNWKPGRQRGKTVNVKYNIPIRFRLQQDEPKQEEEDVVSFSLKENEDTSIGTIEAVKNSIRATRAIIDVDKEESYEEKPLVVVDGKVMGHGTELLKRIDVASIQQVYVMSSKNAVAEYGDQAKDGAIVITFKKK